MRVACQKCKHVWEYTGKKHRTSCARCKTSVTIIKKTRGLYFITTDFLNSRAFRQAKSWAESNGESRIALRVNNRGELYL